MCLSFLSFPLLLLFPVSAFVYIFVFLVYPYIYSHISVKLTTHPASSLSSKPSHDVMPPDNMNMSAHGVRNVRVPSSPLPLFSIVCWNACGLLTRSADIILYLHQQQPSILIIIEPLVTHISQQGFPKHHSYNTVSIKHPHDHRNGGFIIYMHKSITYNQHNAQVPHFTTTTATTVALFHIASPSLPRPFILIPVYMSCDATQRDWNSLTSFLQLAPRTFSHESACPYDG